MSSVTVNGAEAVFEHVEAELTITPAEPLDADQAFIVVIQYSGTPETAVGPFGGIDLGWVKFNGGSMSSANPSAHSHGFR